MNGDTVSATWLLFINSRVTISVNGNYGISRDWRILSWIILWSIIGRRLRFLLQIIHIYMCKFIFSTAWLKEVIVLPTKYYRKLYTLDVLCILKYVFTLCVFCAILHLPYKCIQICNLLISKMFMQRCSCFVV